MQKHALESLMKFIIKYIWVLGIMLIVLECGSILFSASVLMKRASDGVAQATSGEISNRVSSILYLTSGLAQDAVISDTSRPLYERAARAYSLQQSYGLYMIAVTDENGNVESADATGPSQEPFNLMFRDYMQRLYATGATQITDPLVAGADGKTVNYTIATPILEDGVVKGSVFGSIYFEEIQAILDRNGPGGDHAAYLFGRDHTLVSQSPDLPVGTTFEQLADRTAYMGTTHEQVHEDIEKQGTGSYWMVDQGRLYYMRYGPVLPTEWTLLYCTDFLSMVKPLLPATIFKAFCYLAFCLLVSMVGRRSIARRIASVTQLLDKMSSMQMQLFKTDSVDYNSLLDISQSGFVDQLTGLCTRTFFSSKMEQWQFGAGNRGVVFFIDLDNLKMINDRYGHESGDLAILHFAQMLRAQEELYESVSVRYGGDEFILVVRCVGDMLQTAVCKDICEQMNGEITLTQGDTIPVCASIGIALYPQDGSELADLICKADLALYESKKYKKSSYTYYADVGIS